MNKSSTPPEPLKKAPRSLNRTLENWDLWTRKADAFEMQKKILAGLPFSTLQKLESHSGLNRDVVLSLIRLPSRTLARRKDEGKLSVDESERLYRVITVFRAIVELFQGDVEAARKWFESPCRALGSNSPQEMLSTEVGAREVLNLIGRLEHGVYT